MKKRSPVEREINDFYRTPYHCTDALMRVESFDGAIWEPACGDGELSEVLKYHGHHVISTDLIDRGYGTPGRDFLASYDRIPNIVTNPPYGIAEEFALHALDLAPRKLCLFMRLGWLEGAGRFRRVFREQAPTRIWVCSNRPTLWHGNDDTARSSGGAIAYAWYVWDREVPSKPTCEQGWIQRRPNLDLALLSLARAAERLRIAVDEAA